MGNIIYDKIKVNQMNLTNFMEEPRRLFNITIIF